MEIEKEKAVIEAILFAAGKVVNKTELMAVLEISEDELNFIIAELMAEYENNGRGIEIIAVNDGYQLATKKELYEYLYPIFDKRGKPNLSQAALEILAIIAYNPKITRAEIEAIRGVNSDGTIYKLLEYELIENSGKLDVPGKPTTYRTTVNFLKMFGLKSLEELPELPKYKVDENEQIVIEDIINEEENNEPNKINQEAPMPEREDNVDE